MRRKNKLPLWVAPYIALAILGAADIYIGLHHHCWLNLISLLAGYGLGLLYQWHKKSKRARKK
jgi:hypothetical protein